MTTANRPGTPAVGRRPPHALLVVAHPRAGSLTSRVARQAANRLTDTGHTVDLLDLYAEDFDPRMTAEDEPDWQDRGKVYSAEVRAHMRRVDAADVIVVVFPLWWFGLPAILKGWIDRVWNYGFAYGRSTPRLAGTRMLWLGLSSYPAPEFAALGWDRTVQHVLRSGISEFCGITDVSVEFLHDSLGAGPRLAADADNVLAAFLTARPAAPAGSPTSGRDHGSGVSPLK